MPKLEREKLNCVDLFAGAGGFSLGAIRAGIRVIAAVENSRHAAETYRQNLVTKHKIALYEEDIQALNPRSFAKKHFTNTDRCDLVLGGPPCQGFSVHRINNAGVKDPRNRLILRYFEFVRSLRPRAFLMENVPGITWSRHARFLDAFYNAADDAGYETYEPVLLDARDYGVPQRRKRVFILGLKKGTEFIGDWPPPATHVAPRLKDLYPEADTWQIARPIFSVPPSADDPNDVHMRHSDAIVEVFRSTPVNGGSRHQSSRTLVCHENYSGHNDVYGRIDPEQPGPTMTTACINPSKGRFVHPTEHHGITLRQAARFQTFPDNFIFTGGLMAAGAQIGNAVPVTLAEVLLRHIAQHL